MLQRTVGVGWCGGDLHEGGHRGVLRPQVQAHARRHTVQGVVAAETNTHSGGQEEGEDEVEVGDEDHGEEVPEAAPQQHHVAEKENSGEAGEDEAGDRGESSKQTVKMRAEQTEAEVENKSWSTRGKMRNIARRVLKHMRVVLRARGSLITLNTRSIQRECSPHTPRQLDTLRALTRI